MTKEPLKQRHFRPKEAADYLRLDKNTLDKWRSQGRGPAYSRLGTAVVYRIEDLDSFLASTRTSTEVR